MFFQMAARRDPMADVNEYLRRTEAMSRFAPTPRDYERAAEQLLFGSPRKSGDAPSASEEMRSRSSFGVAPAPRRASPGSGEQWEYGVLDQLEAAFDDMAPREELLAIAQQDPLILQNNPTWPRDLDNALAWRARDRDATLPYRNFVPPSAIGGEAVVREPDAVRAERARYRQAIRAKGVNGHGYSPASEDLNLLARAGFAEGANTPEDMDAIAFSIVNRVRPNFRGSGRPEVQGTLEEVLRVPRQYSFMPYEDGNGPEGSPNWVLSADPERMNETDRRSWNAAVGAAKRALSGQFRDPTEHATYFFADPNYDWSWRTAPPGFYRDSLRDGKLALSPYRTPYARPNRRDEPWPNYFFQHPADRIEGH